MFRTLRLPFDVVRGSDESPETCAEERALAGQPHAWNELVRKHNHRVVLTLLSRGVRPESARDVAQEAWTRLIEQQRLGRLREIKMPGLAIKQALFLARDLARREEMALRTESLPQSLDPEPRLWARERLQQTRQVLSRCTPSEKKVFQAMYGSRCSGAAEVARDTGLSIQRVRQILCEVRKKLRNSMRGPLDE